MKQYYAVEEFYGEWEDGRDHLIGVCVTEELAQQLKEMSENNHKHAETSISENEWLKMQDIIDYESGVSDIDQLHTAFPQYTVEDLKNAYDCYENLDEYNFTEYYPVDIYESVNDLKNYNGSNA